MNHRTLTILECFRNKIQIINEADEEESGSINIPDMTPEMPKRFTIHHEVDDADRRRIFKNYPNKISNENPFDLAQSASSNVKFVMLHDNDKEKRYDSSKHFETPVRLNDISIEENSNQKDESESNTVIFETGINKSQSEPQVEDEIPKVDSEIKISTNIADKILEEKKKKKDKKEKKDKSKKKKNNKSKKNKEDKYRIEDDKGKLSL